MSSNEHCKMESSVRQRECRKKNGSLSVPKGSVVGVRPLRRGALRRHRIATINFAFPGCDRGIGLRRNEYAQRMNICRICVTCRFSALFSSNRPMGKSEMKPDDRALKIMLVPGRLNQGPMHVVNRGWDRPVRVSHGLESVLRFTMFCRPSMDGERSRQS
jgi:hypothetical protein